MLQETVVYISVLFSVSDIKPWIPACCRPHRNLRPHVSFACVISCLEQMGHLCLLMSLRWWAFSHHFPPSDWLCMTLWESHHVCVWNGYFYHKSWTRPSGKIQPFDLIWLITNMCRLILKLHFSFLPSTQCLKWLWTGHLCFYKTANRKEDFLEFLNSYMCMRPKPLMTEQLLHYLEKNSKYMIPNYYGNWNVLIQNKFDTVSAALKKDWKLESLSYSCTLDPCPPRLI